MLDGSSGAAIKLMSARLVSLVFRRVCCATARREHTVSQHHAGRQLQAPPLPPRPGRGPAPRPRLHQPRRGHGRQRQEAGEQQKPLQSAARATLQIQKL